MLCRKTLENSEKQQNQFKGWVVASNRFSENERAALKLDSVATFNDYWRETNNARASFDRSTENDFSPIVQIVRDFGAPYGGLALGTISLLFVVSAKSSAFEKSITQADPVRRQE